MSELLPCPWCSNRPIVRDMSRPIGWGWECKWQVSCDHCNVDLSAPTERDAVERWNTRAQPIAPAPGVGEAGRTQRLLPDNQVWVLYAGDDTNPVGFTHDGKWAGEWVNQLECRFAKIVPQLRRQD